MSEIPADGIEKASKIASKQAGTTATKQASTIAIKQIDLWGVRQNNLKNIDVSLPIGKLSVVCGPSGSGKSSLAFNTLFAEGQRRFVESMSNYSKQYLGKAPKPDIEGVSNLPPAIAIEQKNTVKGSRSTVGTTTEILDHLRLLFEKLGISECPDHGFRTQSLSPTDAAAEALKWLDGERGYLLVEVGAKSRSLKGKDLLQQIVNDGFVRMYTDPSKAKPKALKGRPLCEIEVGEVKNLEPQKLKKGLPTRTFFLVIDRLMFREQDQDRLVDSIAQAYEASLRYNSSLVGGQAFLLTTSGLRLKISEFATCPVCEFTPPQIQTGLFSFNSPVGACGSCKGFGNSLELDEKKVVPNASLSLDEGALHPFEMPSSASDRRELRKFCSKEGIDGAKPWEKLSQKHREMIWHGTDDFYGVVGFFDYYEAKKYKMHVRVLLSRYKSAFECPVCKGSRLKPETEWIKFANYSIQQLSKMTVRDLLIALEKIELTAFEKKVADDPLKQVLTRLRFLNEVGVGYLTIDRESRTLSGGEYQRLMVANQLCTGLSQSMYILDEPTVGLHPRDNHRLINILHRLRDLGNTVVVVEHDQDVIESCDNVLEMGPGSGIHGGELLFNGPLEKFYDFAESNTVRYLKKDTKPSSAQVRPVTLEANKHFVQIEGCIGHNLKNVGVKIPLNRLVCVTGVSGSGKSSLITGTLYPAIAQALKLEVSRGLAFDRLKSFKAIKNVVLIDQSSIGKTARSIPATYLKVYDAIRKIMADTPDSRLRGYTPGTFSLNVEGGRCPVCKGLGYEEVDMMFMDNVRLTCDACDGKKFRSEILEIRYKKKNIFEILNFTVAEAMQFFVENTGLRKTLSLLREVGLDYIQLGQPASTLSGGESQRLKICKELSQTGQKGTLYILDEPTTGLHFREVEMLVGVLQRLIDGGGSVIVVEHNLDVIRSSDHIIDIGPEAGESGGTIVVEGSVEDVKNCPNSHTGKYL